MKSFITLSTIIPRKIHQETKEDGSTVFDLLIVTDMDNFAKVESQKWKWRAITRKGKLTLDAEKKNVNVEWDTESDQDIASGLNYKGRAMELSDLSEYNGHLLSPDDKTGMLYEIKDGKAIPWVFLNSGPGNTTKGMKVEWLTIRNDFLYAGGHGAEYRNENGDVVSEDPMWIKIITKRGEVRSKNWNRVFSRVRNEAGYPAPGYLTHEAVQWSEKLQQWLFLPRKASKTPYVESEDEKKGTNLLIKGTPDLKSFEVVRIGTEEVEHPDRGFSAFDFIPGTEDRLIAAIKSREVEGEDPESYITVFDVDGNVLMEDMQLDGNYKFEGLYFV
ncbi:Apyrase [Ancylostoma ceylanicum]|uniref:Apyrase n=2 Tax=Ancylostoma ceylanicum TaxID=53326 RepID=A0A0D6LHK2_9BILA|nr:Apyrase [Ancylostoma ceylanicum]